MSALTTQQPPSSGRSNWRFAAHYAEMVLVMFTGMGILYGLAVLSRGLGGPDLVAGDDPALALTRMGVSMVLPMVAWMWWRGHSWAANVEMALAMIVPTLAALALLAAGTVTDKGALMLIQHVIMLPAMLGVMLLRRDEYSHRHTRS
jgi:flagellar biosynthetic protein FliP